MRGKTALAVGLILVTFGVIPATFTVFLTELLRSKPILGAATGRKSSCFYRYLLKDFGKVLRSGGLLPYFIAILWHQ